MSIAPIAFQLVGSWRMQQYAFKKKEEYGRKTFYLGYQYLSS